MTPLLKISVLASALAVASSSAMAQSGLDSSGAANSPRQLSPEDTAKLRQSVQKSKTRSLEQARQAERQRQEQARQWEETQRQAEAAAAAQEQENAIADAEFEQERAAKAAAWNAAASEREQALADSIGRLNRTVARVQEHQAEATRRSSEALQDKDLSERRRQVELIGQATRRQYAEGDRLAAARTQSEQQRAQAKATEAAAAEGRSADRLREQAAAERAKLREQAGASPVKPALASASASASGAKPGSPGSASASGGIQQTFLGRTCADAHASARIWVGNGSFKVESEQIARDGTCRVMIRYTSGSSTGIRQ